MTELTKKEEILLLAVYRLDEDAYGVLIRRCIKEMTGRQWNYGSLYRMLEQLVTKCLLTRNEGRSMPERGGRRKNFYSLTRKGLLALRDAQLQHHSVWGTIEEIAVDPGGRT